MQNIDLKVNNLNEVTKDLFEKGIKLAMGMGITQVAPLGFSGDDVILFGTSGVEVEGEGWKRRSLIQIRNYCSTPELLITDKEGRFLFYGRFDVNDYDFILDQFWNIFVLLKEKIESHEEKLKKENIDWQKVGYSEGFKMINLYLENMENR